jgi:hypothetical protein
LEVLNFELGEIVEEAFPSARNIGNIQVLKDYYGIGKRTCGSCNANANSVKGEE